MGLIDAFDLKPGAVVAAIGGGGKTSLVYALGAEAAEQGLSAIISSTTKFTRSPNGMPDVVESTDASSLDVLASHLAPGRVVVASGGPGSKGRMLGFAPETVDRWQSLSPGLIALEADGSAGRPFKAPGDHEPVIPGTATDVIVCVGLDVLGKPLDERHVHRPEVVARLARAELGQPVDINTIMRVLSHDEGGRKGLPEGARVHALLNGPATDEQRAIGARIAGRLIFAGYYRAIVATLHRGEIDTIAC